MKIITERQVIREYLSDFKRPGSEHEWGEEKTKALRALDPKTCTVDAIAEIIGDVSWLFGTCDECWKTTTWQLQLGQGGAEVLTLCRSCFGKAVSLVQQTLDTPSDAPKA